MNEFESTLKGVLSIAPNAVCDEDKELVDSVRERNVELVNRLAEKDQAIKSVRALARNRDSVDSVEILRLLA